MNTSDDEKEGAGNRGFYIAVIKAPVLVRPVLREATNPKIGFLPKTLARCQNRSRKYAQKDGQGKLFWELRRSSNFLRLLNTIYIQCTYI